MQDRYIGDVGDFGKYGLLRILTGRDAEQRLKLGVIWYLFSNESHNSDGKHISYLGGRRQDFRDCDEELYDKLRGMLFNEAGLIATNRSTVVLESKSILPQGTVFYSRPLFYEAGQSVSFRNSLRKEWFADALSVTARCDLVFLDPDNGIECASVTRTKNKGPKYVFWDDIDALVQRGQSIVVYHHLNRVGSHAMQVEGLLTRAKERYGSDVGLSALTYRRGTSRVYLIIASSHHREWLSYRAETMCAGLWGRHFVLK